MGGLTAMDVRVGSAIRSAESCRALEWCYCKLLPDTIRVFLAVDRRTVVQFNARYVAYKPGRIIARDAHLLHDFVSNIVDSNYEVEVTDVAITVHQVQAGTTYLCTLLCAPKVWEAEARRQAGEVDPFDEICSLDLNCDGSILTWNVEELVGGEHVWIVP